MTNLTDRECPHGALTNICPECSLVEPLVASIALVRERDALRAALDELLAVRALAQTAEGCSNDRFETAWKAARAARAKVKP
jgi:hypothetical protein